MRWIPRLLAGTAVVVAAALTAAPVTAGLADLVLNPGPPTTKRNAQQALTSVPTPATPVTGRTEESSTDDGGSHQIVEGTIVDDSTDGPAFTGSRATGALSIGAQSTGALSAGTELVAATTADAQDRIAGLSADLQAGVAAGEFTQADADRVLTDIAGYIHGDRTWPERLTP
ncbi:hypothetical protein ACPUD8_09575 [Brevibacterium sp. FAM 25378]|uniref:hypothetical protein n=1 Tax=unclassified Brevibacterium TaxID=2614124 RepID=UPI001092F996|nr:hypothetical protein [Brevibacterium sp. S22]TGD31806.1 hypothetical protein EB835_07045 [Brevibacterium sp. S22]